MPAASWKTSIDLLQQQQQPYPLRGRLNILTYDRFGQGMTTDRDPLDKQKGREAGFGHDFLDVVHDLHELIDHVRSRHDKFPAFQELQLFLVGASIGGPLARLYAQTYPRTVSGLLILDSNVCNRNYSDFWPDVSTAKSNPQLVVTDDCTLNQFLESSAKLAAMFDLKAKNAEGLDRRTTPDLLPRANGPTLEGPDGKSTKLIVVGHDPVTFEDEGFRQMGTPKSLTRRYTQPAWSEYNTGLLGIGDVVGAQKDVVIAPGCGHFIQRDNPAFVADQVRRMLNELDW